MTDAQVANLADSLPADVVRALIEQGKRPIPDSLWFGQYSHLRARVDACRWTWSPLGERVRAYLMGKKR